MFTNAYTVTISHLMQTENINAQKTKTIVQCCLPAVRRALRELEYHPSSFTTDIYPDPIKTVYVLRLVMTDDPFRIGVVLSSEEVAIRLMKSLWYKTCKHAFVTIAPVEDLYHPDQAAHLPRRLTSYETTPLAGLAIDSDLASLSGLSSTG